MAVLSYCTKSTIKKMKKIDRLFITYPELIAIRDWIRKTLTSKSPHPIKNVYKRYTLRTPKHLNKAIQFIQEKEQDLSKIWWAYAYVNHYYWGSALFEYLDKCFSKIKDLNGFRSMLKNLHNKEQFWDTISEIEFNAYFAGRYQIELEPKLWYSPEKFKKLDSRIKLHQRDLFFEILTPKMNEALFKGNGAKFLPNRSKNKFLDKLDGQLQAIKDIARNPIILVINCSYSEIDEIDIENTILGEDKFNWTVNRKTGEAVDFYETRDNNAMVDTNPNSKCISAVLFYKRFVKPWGIEFKKSLILNKKADYPLSATEYKKLCRFDLRKISL